MEEKALNEKESLELIARMIRNTQDRLESAHGQTFLAFGYAILFTTFLVWLLLRAVGPTHWPHWLWFLIPLIGYGTECFSAKNRPRQVITYMDKVIGYIWLVITIDVILIPFAIMLIGAYRFPILFFIFQLVTLGVTLTGLVVRYKPLIIGGAIGILLAFGFWAWPDELPSYFSFGLISVVSMIIPGHMITCRAKKQQQKKRSCSAN